MLAGPVFPTWPEMSKVIMEMSDRALGHNPALVSFATWSSVWMLASIFYVPAIIPCLFSFRTKLQIHRHMLDQMASFDVRAAKCTVPADRRAIEQQVTELFGEKVQSDSRPTVDEGEVRIRHFHLSGPRGGDPLDYFNQYVRGSLRDFVIQQIGNELHVPYRVCLTAFLPMIFFSSVNILGCDWVAMLLIYFTASPFLVYSKSN